MAVLLPHHSKNGLLLAHGLNLYAHTHAEMEEGREGILAIGKREKGELPKLGLAVTRLFWGLRGCLHIEFVKGTRYLFKKKIFRTLSPLKFGKCKCR